MVKRVWSDQGSLNIKLVTARPPRRWGGDEWSEFWNISSRFVWVVVRLKCWRARVRLGVKGKVKKELVSH